MNELLKDVPLRTNRPIYGMLTQPLKDSFPKEIKFDATQYIATSHVKFLEAAGARVVPIDYTLPEAELRILLQKVNGAYIPGDCADALYD